MRSKVIAAILVVLVAVGGGWWYTKRSRAASTPGQPQYQQARVQQGVISSSIQGTGPVASINGVAVKANQSGTVTKILAQDGDQVKAGQPIVVLTNDNLEANLKQAQIDLLNNQASLDNLLNPQETAVRSQELKVQSARLTLKQRETDAAALQVGAPAAGVIASVKGTVGSSLAANTLLFTIFDDSSPTFTAQVPQQAASRLQPGQTAVVEIPGLGTLTGRVEQNGAAASPTSGNKDANVPVDIALPASPGLRAGMVGQATFEATGLSYQVVVNGSVVNDAVEVRTGVAGTLESLAVREGDRVSSGQALGRLSSDTLLVQLDQARNDVTVQEEALANLLHPAGDPNSQLRTLRNKVEQSTITLATRQSDFNDLTVKAPVDGQISGLNLRIGDRITTNAQLFRVADYGQMQITISVDELDVAKAAVGQKAAVTLDALPGRTYNAKVTKINPEGLFRNDIATFEVTVQVEKPVQLLAGMNSTVSITVEEKQGLWVPAQAVQVARGRAVVQQLENGQVVQKEVQIGLRTAQRVEVLGGLTENEQVITAIIRPSTAAAAGFGLFGGGNRGPQQNQTTFPVQQPVGPAGGGNFPGGGNFQRQGGGGAGGGGGR